MFKRATLILVCLFALASPTLATKTLTSSVAFTDPQGNPVVSGYIILRLSVGAKVIANGEVVNQTNVKISLDATGKVVAGQVIFANDELLPTGTYYVMNLFSANDALLRGPENWILSGGAPIDLSLITSSNLPDPGLSNPVLQNPATTQTTGAFALSIPVVGTVTENSSSVIQATAGQNQINSYLLNNVRYVDGVKYPATLAGIQQAFTDLGGPGTVVVPPGTYSSSTVGLTMTVNNQQLICDPNTIISYTGGSTIPAVLDMGNSSNGSSNQENSNVYNCAISGNANVTDTIRTRGVHRSILYNVRVINGSGPCMHINFSVMLNISQFHCSLNEQNFTNTPSAGIVLDGPDTSHCATEGYITGSVVEGTNGQGVWVKCGYEWTIRDNAFEGQLGGSGRGIQIDNNSGINRNIIAFQNDLEANAVEDVLNNGPYNQFFGNTMISTVGMHNGATSSHAYLGSGNRITTYTCDAGGFANVIDGSNNITSTFTDNCGGGYLAGAKAGIALTSTGAPHSTLVGDLSGQSITNGNHNTCLGWGSCGSLTTGSSNIGMGANQVFASGDNFQFAAGSNSDPITDVYFGTGKGGAAQPWTLHASQVMIIPAAGTGTGNLFWTGTAPGISGFNTNGTIAQNNGSAVIQVTVGSGTAGSTGTLTFPTATHGWVCFAQNQSRADLILQSSNSATSCVLTNFGTTFAATNFTNGDTILVTAFAF